MRSWLPARLEMVLVLFVLLSLGGQPLNAFAGGYRQGESAAPGSPAAQPDGEVAYVKAGNVYLLYLQTGWDRQLTGEGSVLPGLRWSPDGRWLAYMIGEQWPTSSRLLDLQTGESREIPLDAGWGSFSPDGRWLAFRSEEGLSKMSLDSLEVAPVTRTAHEDTSPDYAPDGSLYFVRRPFDGQQYTTTLIMRLTPSGEERVVFDAGISGGICAPSGLDAYGDDWIAFGIACGTRGRMVNVLNVRSGALIDVRELFGGTGCVYLNGWAHKRPVLAIVDSTFCSDFPDVEKAIEDLVLIAFDDPRPRGQVVARGQLGYDTAWSPDDQWLAITENDANGQPQGILLISARGGPPRQLTAAGGGPAWRPGTRSHTFPETGHTVSGRFWEVWQRGRSFEESLYINGFPITDKHDEVSPTDGRVYQTQWFERARFEEHLENDRSHDVLLGLLGVRAAQGRAQEAPFRPVADPGGGLRWFAQTGHTLGDAGEGGRAIARFWDELGGLEQFGYPLSQPFMEQSKDDGKTYLVQYFERQRFEYHPENRGTRFEVLLGRLGAEQLGR